MTPSLWTEFADYPKVDLSVDGVNLGYALRFNHARRAASVERLGSVSEQAEEVDAVSVGLPRVCRGGGGFRPIAAK